MEENIIENPFELTDFVLEKNIRIDRGLKPYPIVETEGSKFIEEVIRSGESTIIIGEKGTGKSAAVAVAGVNLILKEHRKIMIYKEYESLIEICYSLWNFASLPPEIAKSVQEYLYRQTQISDWIGHRCKYWSCKRRDRCVFKVDLDRMKPVPTAKECKVNIDHNITVPCPMKKMLFLKLLNRSDVINHLKKQFRALLIDIPNKFTKQDAEYLNELLPKLLRIGNIVFLMNTEQYITCREYENLQRLPIRPFPILSIEEVKQIILSRIESSSKYEHLIVDEILNSIITLANNNPRKAINLCGLYIDEKKFPSLTGNLKVIQALQLKEKKALPNYLTKEEELVISTVSMLKTEIPKWIKVKQIKDIINKNCNTDLSSKKIGRTLKNKLKLRHRYNPDSEYLI